MATNTKNFYVSEFDCKNCSCGGFNNLKQETIDLAQKIRDYLMMPMIITSGCRCDKKQEELRKTNENAAQGRSAHQDGEAFDFIVEGMYAEEIGAKIKEMYNKGLIPELQYSYFISKTAVHVGIDKKTRWRRFAY